MQVTLFIIDIDLQFIRSKKNQQYKYILDFFIIWIMMVNVILALFLFSGEIIRF